MNWKHEELLAAKIGKDSQDHTNTSGTAGEFHSGRVMGGSQSAEADTDSGSQYCSGTDIDQ